MDEFFARSDSGGSYSPITDALGSALALVDSSGNLATQYTYDPFGSTATAGSASSNTFQYTGRENDNNNALYYYRSRYYSPQLGRFISEDSAGFGGSGTNFYAYVDDDPIDLSDPDGFAATVIRNGNVIDVSASFTIYGPRASSALAAQWQREINNAWNNSGNNFRFGRCTVMFNITVQADPSHNTRRLATPADNYAYVRPSGFRSFTSRVGGSYGEWSISDHWAVAHEAGHNFGLPDDYHDVMIGGQTVSVPNPTHSGHIMGQWGGIVVQHEINDLMHQHRCTCR